MSQWVKSRVAVWRFGASACIAAAVIVALSIACGGQDPTPTSQVERSDPATATSQVVQTESETKLKVVTSTSIIEDWVREVGGDRVTVNALVPRQADPHSFQPGARDIAAVADADLVFVVGLGLEETWLDDLIRNAAKSPDAIVELTDGIETIPFSDPFEDHDEDEHGHADEDEDAHDEEEHGDDDHADEDADGHDEDHADEDGDEHDEDEHGDEDHADEDADGHDEDHADEDGDEHDEDEHGDEDHADEDADGHDEDHADEDGDEHDEDEHGHDDEDADAHEEDDHGHGHGSDDPHFWMDPTQVKVAVESIERKLSELDPDSSTTFRNQAAAYLTRLDELDAWAMERVNSIPEANRLLVTTHDAWGYFANRYGFRVVGTVIPGGGTEVEPSPTELTALSDRIQEIGLNVIFTEEQLSDSLAQTLATEAGANVVGGLYTGSLGADGTPASSYIGLIRHDVDIIVGALTGN